MAIATGNSYLRFKKNDSKQLRRQGIVIMSRKSILFAGVAALALGACGGGGDSSASSTDSKPSRANVAAANSSSGSPFDAKFSLKGASALDIDGLIAQTGYDGEKLYGAASFDEKLGATVVTDIKFDSGDGGIVTIAKAELFGVDEAAITSVTQGTAAFDAPFETVLRKVRLYDVKVSADALSVPSEVTAELGFDPAVDPADFVIGGVEIDTLKVRQGGIVEDAGEDTMLAQIFNVFDLGGLYFKDINLSFASEQTGSFGLSAPDLRMVGLGGGKLNALISNDFTYSFKQSAESLSAAFADDPQTAALFKGPLGAIMGLHGQRVTTKTMSWRDIDASGLLPFGLRGELPPMSEKNLISLGHGEMLGMEQYIGEKRLLSADKTTFVADDFVWLIPTKITSDVKGTSYDFTAYVPEGEEELLAIMTKYGMNDSSADGVMSWTYNEKTGNADLNYAFDIKNFADINFTMNGGNFVYDEIATLVENENQAALQEVGNFKGLDLTIKDANLLDMVFDIAALQMGGGMTGPDLRQSTPAMMRLTGGQVSALNPRIDGYIDALAEFLSDGGTLSINANPDEAVPISQLAIIGETAPQTLPDVLGLTVTHKK